MVRWDHYPVGSLVTANQASVLSSAADYDTESACTNDYLSELNESIMTMMRLYDDSQSS